MASRFDKRLRQADWIRVCLSACFFVYFSVCLFGLSVCLRCLTIFLTLCRTAQCNDLFMSAFQCATNRNCQVRMHVACVEVWHLLSLPAHFVLPVCMEGLPVTGSFMVEAGYDAWLWGAQSD